MINNTQILYIGSFLENGRESDFWKNSKGMMVLSGDKFQKTFLDGFKFFPNTIDYIINLPAIGSFPFRYKKIWINSSSFKYNDIKGENCSFLNLSIIKEISIYQKLKRKLLDWCLQNIMDKKTIIVYSIMEPYLKAAIEAKKRYPEIKICCIVLDLPEFFDEQKTYLHFALNKMTASAIYNMIPLVDYFIVLTEQMVFALNIENKPWLLLEGHYKPIERKILPKERKTILYTGKLDTRFGISDLINAFSNIQDKDYRLWICGDGTERKSVEKATIKDNRISYFGMIKPDKVLEMQTQATLLVNPRKCEGSYTMYSFPSKTLEYMASGTPVVMYPLEGMPKEYYQYLVIVPDNSNKTLSDLLVEWCEKDQNYLNAFGEKAKQFILNNKITSIQGQRTYEFLNNILNA